MILLLGTFSSETPFARGGENGKITSQPSSSPFRMIASGSPAPTNNSTRRQIAPDAPPQPYKESSGSEPVQPQTSPAQPKPSILVPDIPDKDNGQVIVAYKSKIEETQTLMRTINESQLTKEQHDTLISIHSFLEKAQEAFSQDDMPMAVNLAEKAHTLTKEIVKNSTKP